MGRVLWRRRSLLWNVCALSLVVLAAGMGVFAAGWSVSGGRLFFVTSPSMGEAAPVGTVLLTRPVTVADARPGDIVSFRPTPVSPVYSHRVAVKRSGFLLTKGDVLDTVDGWELRDGQLLGRTVASVRVVGWLFIMGPFLSVGFVLVLLFSWLLGGRGVWQEVLLLVGFPFVIAVGLLLFRPLLGVEGLGVSAGVGEVPRQLFVSTGLFPTEVFNERSFEAVVLGLGQTGVLPLTHADAFGRVNFLARPAFVWWQWLLVALLCALPALLSLFVRERVPAAVEVSSRMGDASDGGVC